MKRAGDAAPHGRFRGAGGGRGEIHAFKHCSREWSSAPVWQVFFSGVSGAALSVASVAVEDEGATVFAEDLDQLAGFVALVEQLEVRLRIVNYESDK